MFFSCFGASLQIFFNKDLRIWNYYGDELNDDLIENNDDNYRVNNKNITKSKSFEYKTKILGNTIVHNNTLNTEVLVPLKYLSNWRYLHLILSVK